MRRSFLAQCEQEQLHRSGAIQPHGTLLMLDADQRVCHVASNCTVYLGQPPEAWLGKPLPPPLATLVQELTPPPGRRRFQAACVDGALGLLDLVITTQDEGKGWTLELTPTQHPCNHPLPHAIPPGFATEDQLQAARQQLLEHIAHQTGASRVLYYLFHPEGDGEVIHEFRQGEAFGSYLGLHFPASDIPRIARALYLKNPWRLIPDARQASVPLLGLDAEVPDLSRSDLRSISPIHQIYLANMGVVGTLSFPVVVAGELAALITAHHASALLIPARSLEALSDRVRSFNLSVAAYRAQGRMRMIDNLTRRFEALRVVLLRHGDLLSAWGELAPQLLDEFQADGAVLQLDTACSAIGHCFEPASLGVFDAWFCARSDELVWLGDQLGRQIPGFPLSEIAGVLAIQLQSALGPIRIYLTRTEHIHEVAWGGNPDKPVEQHAGPVDIAPRRSFEKWIETRLGYSRPWRPEARLLGLKLRGLLQAELRH